jgi:transposase-like protein
MAALSREERRRRRFSEAFRKEQVAFIAGGLKTVSQVCQECQVSRNAVRRWIATFGKEALPKMILDQTEGDLNRIQHLEKEKSYLKQVAEDQQVEILYLRQVLALAKEHLGQDFEKNTGESS